MILFLTLLLLHRAPGQTPFSASDSLLLAACEGRLNELWESAGPDSLSVYTSRKAEIYRRHDQLQGWMSSYFDLHDHYYGRDDFAAALPWLDTILQGQWRAPQDREERQLLLWVQTLRAYDLMELGYIFRATEAYENALKLYRPAEDAGIDALEYIYKPLGNNYTRLGDNQKALNLFYRAVDLARAGGDGASLFGLYNNLGLAYWNMGRHEESIAAFREGLGLPGMEERWRALLESNLARSLFSAGDTAGALALAEKTYRSLRHLASGGQGDPAIRDWTAGVLTLLGEISFQQKEYRRAEDHFQKALSLTGKPGGRQRGRRAAKIYLALGAAILEQGDGARALALSNQALQAVLPGFQPTTEGDTPSAATFHAENVIAEALTLRAQACRLRYREGDTDLLWLARALHAYELALAAEERLWQTYQYTSSKLALQAESRRRLEGALEAADLLHRQTGEAEWVERAFRLVERRKAGVLFDGLQENLTLRALDNGDSLFLERDQWLHRRAFLQRTILDGESGEAIHRQMREADLTIDELSQRLYRRFPELETTRNERDTFALPALRQYLGAHPGALLIEFFAGERDFFTFTLEEEGRLSLLRLPHRNQLDSLIQKLAVTFRQPEAITDNPQLYFQDAQALFRQLLLPSLEQAGGSPSSLLIIPDGSLHWIPFEALLTQAYEGPSMGKAPYLLHRYRVRYAYSGAVLLRQEKMFSGPSSLLIVAPGFLRQEERLLPLPAAAAEAGRIAGFYPGSRQLSGTEATLAAFRDQAPRYGLLHLATHASVNGPGSAPQIELADSSLFLPELYTLKLSADLVVLSGCETALGDLKSGEGLMSLARGFTYAGSASLVASLWQVNDEATAALMAGFYRRLREQYPKSEALHQARLDYLHDPRIRDSRKSPYYWSAFVLIGRDSAVNPGASYFGWRVFVIAGAILLPILFSAGWHWRRKRSQI